MSEPQPFALFECFGIELEYMIVESQSLDVRPIADLLLADESGEVQNEVERDAFAWSNELALHVIELKTNGPAPSFAGLGAGFAGEVASVNASLSGHGACLLPTGMHPWMNPDKEFQIWPYGSRAIYEAFDHIFDCSGHGWANLQSMHLNLPFANDDEFGRLHAAARALLPILPALAASTPFVGGRHNGTLDTRLDVYRNNAQRVPSVAGQVIPEPIFTRRDYEAMLDGIYADLLPHDPKRVLRHEWVNSRGCIARFDRMAIEIRVLDVQECPRSDIAIAYTIARILERLCDRDPRVQDRLRRLETKRLASILWEATLNGNAAAIDDSAYFGALGLASNPRTLGEVWQQLIERDVFAASDAAEHRPALRVLLDEGPLARRLLSRLGPNPSNEALRATYRDLADCLGKGELFRAAR